MSIINGSVAGLRWFLLLLRNLSSPSISRLVGVLVEQYLRLFAVFLLFRLSLRAQGEKKKASWIAPFDAPCWFRYKVPTLQVGLGSRSLLWRCSIVCGDVMDWRKRWKRGFVWAVRFGFVLWGSRRTERCRGKMYGCGFSARSCFLWLFVDLKVTNLRFWSVLLHNVEFLVCRRVGELG